MCGIVLLLKRAETHCDVRTLNRMRDEVVYRGPDDQGTTVLRRDGRMANADDPANTQWEVGLAHRRLSILDLSPAGHQPMVYRRNFWIVYNGEVYNYVELRAELERLGHSFRSTCDTEVILAAYAQWGTECFPRFNGMWGMAIVDVDRREVVLARDRLGIKPIYYWQGPGILAAVSETKQLFHAPGFQPRLHHPAAAEFLQTSYENPRWSFLEGVVPVPPAHWMKVSLSDLRVSTPEEYWHLEGIRPSLSDPEEVGRAFLEKLTDSVRVHLRSDVPVGFSLSGGLDSSAITILASAQHGDSADASHTFTSTFPGQSVDEREYVDAVLDQIRVVPHFVTPSPTQFLADLDHFVWIQDEPLSTLSTYASFCIARLTRECGVPVILSGQGGDEVLSGYWQSYFMYLRHLALRMRLGSLAAHGVGALLPGGNAGLLRQLPFMLRRYRVRSNSATLVRFRNLEVSGQRRILEEVLSLDEHERRIQEIRAMYLPRLLKWDDRNSMAFSVEGRYPFLDHGLIELCLSFHTSTLYRRGWTKMPLRLSMRETLPRRVTFRKTKFGFETPQEQWICGPLRPTLEAWLQQDRPVWQYVDPADVRRLAHLTWSAGPSQQEPCLMLLRIFMFDRWLHRFNVSP